MKQRLKGNGDGPFVFSNILEDGHMRFLVGILEHFQIILLRDGNEEGFNKDGNTIWPILQNSTVIIFWWPLRTWTTDIGPYWSIILSNLSYMMIKAWNTRLRNMIIMIDFDTMIFEISLKKKNFSDYACGSCASPHTYRVLSCQWS